MYVKRSVITKFKKNKKKLRNKLYFASFENVLEAYIFSTFYPDGQEAPLGLTES